MGSKGGAPAPPPVQQSSGMDPAMMQMMSMMMSQQGSTQRQLPPMPVSAPTPEIQQAEAVNWQDKMVELENQARADYGTSGQKEAQLVEAFYPGSSVEDSSLLTDETNA